VNEWGLDNLFDDLRNRRLQNSPSLRA